jgi:hypothetical protein
MQYLITILLCAAPPAPVEEPSAPTHGHVLVLDNEQTLVGEVERDGDRYRLRRGVGETLTPADRVLRLCADLEEAHVFLQSRANLNDPDERLRLAEWCRRNGLRAQALAEVKAAVALRPDHAETRRLLAHLEAAAPVPALPPAPTPRDEGPPPTPQVDVSADAMGGFVSRVQPILMNACATCHAGGKGGEFKLTRVYDDVSLNRKSVQQNLAAVLAEVNVGEPQTSRLLTKAVSVHGSMEKAPLAGRQAVAFHTLEDWVKRTLADNPQLHERIAGATVSPAPASAFAEGRAEPVKIEETAKVASPAPSAPVAAPAASAPAPKTAADPADPYSPDAFNRQFHPERAPSGPAPKP